MNLVPFLPSPQWRYELGQNILFCKINIIIEFVVQKCAQVTNFTYLVHSFVELWIWCPVYFQIKFIIEVCPGDKFHIFSPFRYRIINVSRWPFLHI